MAWHPQLHARKFDSRHWLKQLVFGLGLVGLGTAYLLGHLGIMRPIATIDLLPGLIAISAAAIMVSARSTRRVIKGLFYLGFAAWLLVCIEHLYGLRFATAWPALLILFGANALLKGLTGDYRMETK